MYQRIIAYITRGNPMATLNLFLVYGQYVINELFLRFYFEVENSTDNVHNKSRDLS